jgi:hypothetical protein
MAETPDNPGYDRNLLGLYDDNRLAETPDNLGYDRIQNFRLFILFGVNRKLWREYCGKVIGSLKH